MNVNAVSCLARRSQDFDTLQSTLQAGNLAGAQRAFAAFLQDVQKTEQLAGPASLFGPGTQANKDLQTLGSALKSANLAGAQQAFATLQQDVQMATQSPGNIRAVYSHHHPFTPAEVSSNAPAAVQAAAQGGAAAQTIGSLLSLKA